MDEYSEYQQIDSQLRSNWERYKPLWDDIARVVGITVDPDYQWNNNQANKANSVDEYVDDPTAALSVNQAGDYLLGIMWGTGEGVLDLKPSDDVLEFANSEQELIPYYSYATRRLLYHMNHPETGYGTALRPYAYDQFSFGTSGIGIFRNESYARGTEQHALIARNYGIDNTCLDEGKGGSPDIVRTIYHWTIARIMGEFCMKDGQLDQGLISKMPDRIQKAIQANDYNQEFDIVFLLMPRHDFDPRLLGSKSARYMGIWYVDNPTQQNVFCTEDFKERPINMARMIKIRGEKYGRSAGTLLLSSINSQNFMFALTADIMEKMANPALGTFGNSIFGDSVLDTSPNALTVFNQQMANGQPPVFPIHDVGDPSEILKFLFPYLQEKITSGFKIDALLDFNSAKDMTATESLQRYNIRGKSLAGMLGMQKNERLIPDVRRAIGCLWDLGAIGVNPQQDKNRANLLISGKKTERIIPDAVLKAVAAGRPWYDISFNNELEKLIRTQEIQSLTQIIQGVTAIAALYQPIVEAIDWYQLLKDLNDSLDVNSKILVAEKDFKKIIANAAAQRAQAAQLQGAQMASSAQKDNSTANKNNAQAQGAINNSQVAGL